MVTGGSTQSSVPPAPGRSTIKTLQCDIGGIDIGFDFTWFSQLVVRGQVSPAVATLIG